METETKYEWLLRKLKVNILDGKYFVGSAFPSERALIARYGLSRNTVQHALRELVRLGFIESRRGAGSFVTKQGAARKIGLVVPGVAYSEFYPPFLSEMNRLASENGYTLLLGEVYSQSAKARVRQVRALAQRFADEEVSGIVYQPFEFLKDSDLVNRELLSFFDASGIAVVLVAADIVPSPDRSAYDVVGINDFEAGRRLALHLRQAGARRVAFLLNENSNHSVQNRLIGVESVFSGNDEFTTVTAAATNVAAMRRLFSGTAVPDAIICRSDAVAARLVVTLRKLKKSVPGDVLLAGFNDISFASALDLTSVRVPATDIANLAFHTLLTRIGNPKILPHEQVLPAPLVVRGSTRRTKRT
ncbi:MAG: substrate-binding domain-containing protein [Treponema sp.]|nr:substrate-binding domain-containing protein [Treponema sp.]